MLRAQALSDVPLFDGLNQEQLAEVAQRLRRRTFETHDVLMRGGETGDSMYILVSGKVKVCTTNDQTETIIAVLAAGDVIGELSVLDGEVRSADVIALERTEALVLSSTDVHALMRTVPAISIALLRGLAGRLRLATEWISVLCQQDVSGRLARLLLNLSRTHGVDLPGGGRLIRLRLIQNDLAGQVGASRESVNKAMGYFENVKWIAKDTTHYITVLDPEALEKRCH